MTINFQLRTRYRSIPACRPARTERYQLQHLALGRRLLTRSAASVAAALVIGATPPVDQYWAWFGARSNQHSGRRQPARPKLLYPRSNRCVSVPSSALLGYIVVACVVSGRVSVFCCIVFGGMSASDGEHTAGRRRGSWARALERFRTVMRRKNTPREEASTATAPQTITNRASLSAIFDPPTLPQSLAVEETPFASKEPQYQCAPQAMHENAVDDREDPDDSEQPLLPLDLGLRTGLSDEKAKVLFERYGLKYQAGKPAAETPSRVRRVEKPIRIRVHWRCHECRVVFGQERTCAACGHRRCTECIREPPKKIVQMLERTRQPTEVIDAGPSNNLTSLNDNVQAIPEQDPASAAMLSDETPTGLSTAPLEKDDHEERGTAEPANFLYSFEARSQAGPGMRLVHRPKAQLVRRVCHECEAPILPASRQDCQNCGHIRCTLCPRWPHKAGKHAHGSPGDAQAKSAATVERVYKKPRQRVRWTCDRCQSAFSERDRCGKCDHERCDGCIRSP